MAGDIEFNMFEAAVKLRMSPEMLKWFTIYPAKQGNKRLLKISRKHGSTFFFSEGELISFDKYLLEPWPSELGKRPPIPAGVEKEIKTETFFQCAVCHSHADSCEMAHIRPVATSQCNHPHNLIYLCANHHTKFDKTGVLGPRKEVTALVVDLKSILLHYKKVMWEVNADALAEAFSIAQFCARLKSEQLKRNAANEIGVYEDIAGKVINKLERTAFSSRKNRDSKDTRTADLWEKLEAITRRRTLEDQVRYAADLSEDEGFRVAAGYVRCPLCEGLGTHDGSECPVCQGDRSVEKQLLSTVDLDSYRMVACPLCKGEREYEGDVCPACNGDQKMQQRYADNIDIRDYQLVYCTLCNGRGLWHREECPLCSGDRKLQQRVVDNVDISDYDTVKCPICEGSGRGPDRNDCRACLGDGQILKGKAEALDRRDFELCKCKLCKGTGAFMEGDCPVCAGDGMLPKEVSDQVEWREYDMVTCPTCDGRSSRGDYECVSCDGNGSLLRLHADRLD